MTSARFGIRFASSSFAALLVATAACGGGATKTAPAATPATAATDTPAPADTPAAPAPTPPGFRLPDTAKPTEYAATLWLDPTAEAFDGEITIAAELKDQTDLLWLNGRDLTIKDASFEVGGQTIAATVPEVDSNDFIALRAGAPIGPGAVIVHLTYSGKVSDKELSGVFRQNEEDNWYLFTQFEAIDARRAFPCFDEPAHKTPWQLTINVKEGQKTFTNTPELSVTDGENGWKTHTFAKSKPIPSYLVAFAAGPFDVVDAGSGGRNDTPLRIIVPKGKSSHARYAVETTPIILARLEDYFDMPYPYEKLDSIVVPSFFGAMENPGLITYASGTIISDPKEETPRFHRLYAVISAHEIAHQWFGNLVTMMWWDDLWLNESFADWVSAKIVRQWKPEWGGDVYAVGQRERAMSADSLMSAKPVKLPIKSRDDIFSNSSAIMYAKGSTVLTMFENWIGEDKFRDGIRGYMKKHAWGNATAEDFSAALSGASSPELAAAFSTFIQQPGYPLISAELTCAKGEAPTLTLSQERYTPVGAKAPGGEGQTWQVPVCARYQGGRDCTLMKEKTAKLALTKTKRCPKWVLANDAAAGYYRVSYAGDMLERALLGPGAKKLTTPERIMAIGDANALVSAGRMQPADAFAMVPKLLVKANPHIVRSAAGIVESIDAYLVPEELRPNYARFIRKSFGAQARKLGFKSKPGEDDDLRLLRPTVISLVADLGQDPKLIAEATELAKAWLADPKAVQPDMVGTVLGIAARNGDAALYEELYSRAKATKDSNERGRLLGAMASFRDPALVERNMNLLLGDEFQFREAIVLMQGPLQDPRTRAKAYEFVKANFDAILKKLPVFYGRFIVFVAAVHCDEAHAEDARKFFEPRVKDMTGGPAALEQVIEQINVCAAQRKAQQPSVAKFLKKN